VSYSNIVRYKITMNIYIYVYICLSLFPSPLAKKMYGIHLYRFIRLFVYSMELFEKYKESGNVLLFLINLILHCHCFPSGLVTDES